MNTKHFVVKIQKSRGPGKIEIKLLARYFPDGDAAQNESSVQHSLVGGPHGQRARIFPLESRCEWGNSANGEFHSVENVSFSSGAEAGKYLEALRQYLVTLENRIQHLDAEIECLPE